MIIAAVPLASVALLSVALGVSSTYPKSLEKVMSWLQAVTGYTRSIPVRVVAHTIVTVGLYIVVHVPGPGGIDME